MHRGYTCLWRKIWSNAILAEPERRFSRLEAWLYITNVLAAGMDDAAAGLKRGEFVASVRQCAECFNWSIGAVQRFLEVLLENSMIMRVVHETIHPAITDVGLFLLKPAMIQYTELGKPLWGQTRAASRRRHRDWYARLNFSRARYEYGVARVALSRALGELWIGRRTKRGAVNEHEISW